MTRILLVVTSHGEIDAEHRTGLWLEEFAIPFEAFRGQGSKSSWQVPRADAHRSIRAARRA